MVFVCQFAKKNAVCAMILNVCCFFALRLFRVVDSSTYLFFYLYNVKRRTIVECVYYDRKWKTIKMRSINVWMEMFCKMLWCWWVCWWVRFLECESWLIGFLFEICILFVMVKRVYIFVVHFLSSFQFEFRFFFFVEIFFSFINNLWIQILIHQIYIILFTLIQKSNWLSVKFL